MENIGKLLKQRREELGLSIDDVSNKTRLTIKHIKAIEEGDISYFRDDLSYLRFFLRSYCEILDIDFEDIKDELSSSINDYTTSFTVDAIKQHRAIEKNVRENANKLTNTTKSIITQKPNKKTYRKKKPHRKIDLSLVSFIVIIAIIVISLLIAAVVFLKDGTPKEEETTPPPIVQQPTNPEESKPEPEPEQEPVKQEEPFAITKVSDTEYTLDHLKDDEEISFEVYFGSHSQFRFLVDDQLQSEPASQIYRFGQTITFKQNAKANKKLTLSFGYMQNNKIKINGIDVEIASSINNNNSAAITSTVKGE